MTVWDWLIVAGIVAGVTIIAILVGVHHVGQDLDRYANEADGEWLS